MYAGMFVCAIALKTCMFTGLVEPLPDLASCEKALPEVERHVLGKIFGQQLPENMIGDPQGYDLSPCCLLKKPDPTSRKQPVCLNQGQGV